MTELEKQIFHYNEVYREGSPEISDSEYDSLLERLKEEQPNSELLKRAVIEKSKESRKVKLPFPMMSLEKVKTMEGLFQWIKEVVLSEDYLQEEIIVTPKFDGISLLQTMDGRFLTRGDGKIGQDCTAHCSFLPLRSSNIKGELIIKKDVWEKNEIFRKYKHPRNVVAGWVNGDYDSNIPYNLMSFVPYSLLDSGLDKYNQLSILEEFWGSTPFVKVKISELTSFLLDEHFSFWKKTYPIDGLVLEFNHPRYRKGTYPNGNPHYMIAYKPAKYSETAETIIQKIELSVNRYGVVTPVVVFDPVNLSGADVSRVNGVNMSYVYDWGFMPGEKIEILRSGEVIPKIVSVEGIGIPFIEEFSSSSAYSQTYSDRVNLRESSPWFIGKFEDFCNEMITCPFCGEILVWDENMTHQLCPNENCPERKFQGIVDFFRIFEVENIAEGVLRSLWNVGFDSVKKVLNITENELLSIEGFAEKSARDFIKSMKGLKKNGGCLARHMHASGCFPNLGEKTLQLILDNYPEEKILIKEDLVKINGIGDKTAEVFIKGYSNFKKNFFSEIKMTYVKTPLKEKKEGVFSGSVFCFTGCRPDEKTREFIESNGAEISENFTSKVTHLVTKDLNSTSSKIEKARKTGIIIMPLDEVRVDS